MSNSWFSGIALLLIGSASALLITGFQSRDTAVDPTESRMNAILPQQIRAVALGTTYRFAGEKLNTEQFDIRERLERELLVNAYLHSATLLSLKRTRRYFPEIERILKEEGLPDDLKYLAVAESALVNATSSAGAKGIWQFMEPTAKAFDLEINGEVDERMHLEKATRAACRYLRSYREKFGSWHLAACAYNMGGPRLEKELREQRAERFEELNLNAETSRYLFRIVALKALMEDPAAFGYDLRDEDYYPALNRYREIRVSGPVENWGDFARKHGTHYRMLKILNPWLTSGKLTNKDGKTYLVRVPA
jgi:membrane-bound lytic murein transglycosylase D